MTDIEKIRLLRHERGLDQTSMAKMLGIAQSTYSDIESGKIKLTAKMKKDILEVLHVTDEAFDKMEHNATTVVNIHDPNGGNSGHTVHAISVEEMLPLINEVVEPHKKLTHHLEDEKESWKIERAEFKAEIKELRERVRFLEDLLSKK